MTSWFEKFELMTRRWSATDRGLEVACYFEGVALQKFQLMTSNNEDYQAIKTHMIEKLQPPDHELKSKSEFYSAKQRPDENVDAFGTRLINCIKSMNPPDRANLNKGLVSVFKSGCSSAIKRSLISMPVSTPFSQILAVAKEAEKCMEEEDTYLNALNETEPSVNAVKSESKCFKCEKVGHFARECPNKVTQAERRSEPSVPCLICGQTGHFAVKCRELEKLKSSLAKSEPKTRDLNDKNAQNNVSFPYICKFCDKQNHTSDQCRFKNVKCSSCNQFGHYSSYCKNLNGRKSSPGPRQ